ncbi:hypothetical protein TNCV_2983961 [Trichonephila clavipes]|nr:hypothetical protein TNCV_2983961 [Trichonephila clavipes]
MLAKRRYCILSLPCPYHVIIINTSIQLNSPFARSEVTPPAFQPGVQHHTLSVLQRELKAADALWIPNLSKPDSAIAQEDQGLLCPTQYTRPCSLTCMNRCSGQVVSQTRNPSVKFPRKLGTHLSIH